MIRFRSRTSYGGAVYVMMSTVFGQDGTLCCEKHKLLLPNECFTKMYILTCQLCCQQQVSLQVTPQFWWGPDFEDAIGRLLS
ncbi:unnamed protein product [Sphagnum troendelagicum]|uniref:Uncharacterized protein n=1 Tax=Sphagnum troendelagicum TaxID=128251 RepID=A0ABP0UMZ6_9BRYO